jgi:hypothetical protein
MLRSPIFPCGFALNDKVSEPSGVGSVAQREREKESEREGKEK